MIDGVTVSKAITLEDKFENLGARLLQDVASKTNEVAGDGTTTATVLARAIFSETVKNVAAGCNPMDLRRGTQAAVEAVVKYLEANKRKVCLRPVDPAFSFLMPTSDTAVRARVADDNFGDHYAPDSGEEYAQGDDSDDTDDSSDNDRDARPRLGGPCGLGDWIYP